MGHELAVCSDMGICNHQTGICGCASGYEGAACEYMKCPGYPLPCSGNGLCLTMRQLASRVKDDANGIPLSYDTPTIPNEPFQWDLDRIRGCDCSDGYSGYDCSLQLCPRGDNPATPHQFNEVQLFSCQLLATGGTFTLAFRDEITIPLSVEDNVNDLKSALESLNSIQRVRVFYTDSSISFGASNLSADALHLCRSDAAQHISIEFESPTGDVPTLVATPGTSTVSSVIMTITEEVKGTKEYITCSGKGICNQETGMCECFPGYSSSDGQGNHGPLPNCGYQSPYRMED